MKSLSRSEAPPRDGDAPWFVLPALVRDIASRLPAFPLSAASAFALAFLAPRLVGRDELASFDGRTFRIVVRDAGTGIAFRIHGAGGFEPVDFARPADVTFTACAADFLMLATRRVDPDTLFFARRLRIEGDTDTGLRLKNVLDAVELPRWLTGAGR